MSLPIPARHPGYRYRSFHSPDVVQPGKAAWHKIREQFGDEVFLDDGHLDREKMGRIVFADNNMRKRLNAITHPEIRKAMMWKIFVCFLKGYQFVVLDLPLLFESRNMVSFLSYIIVVSCTDGQQLQRLMARNGFTREEAQMRIDAQMPMTEKCRLATFIVDNSGTQEMTEKQILDLYHKFRRSRAHWPLRILGWMGIAFVMCPFFKGTRKIPRQKEM
nr:hypothetical protein BaRGS_030888 [Batillaria attramentaria]